MVAHALYNTIYIHCQDNFNFGCLCNILIDSVLCVKCKISVFLFVVKSCFVNGYLYFCDIINLN